MASYVEFSLIEKLHARITEVSPANPGETLNDAVERLIAERDALREVVSELRLIAQTALDHGGDMELVYAPLYQAALEDIASEPQGDE